MSAFEDSFANSTAGTLVTAGGYVPGLIGGGAGSGTYTAVAGNLVIDGTGTAARGNTTGENNVLCSATPATIEYDCQIDGVNLASGSTGGGGFGDQHDADKYGVISHSDGTLANSYQGCLVSSGGTYGPTIFKGSTNIGTGGVTGLPGVSGETYTIKLQIRKNVSNSANLDLSLFISRASDGKYWYNPSGSFSWGSTPTAASAATDTSALATGKAGVRYYGYSNDSSGGLHFENFKVTNFGTALSPGTLNQGTVTPTSAALSIATTTGGTSPYSNQLQRVAHGAGFGSPTNIGSPVTGATASFTDSTVAAGTSYDYRVVVTDSAGSPATANSNTLNVVTPSAATQFTFTGPTGGTSGIASTNFTLTPNGYVTSCSIALSDGGGGGSFTTSPVVFSATSSPLTFTYTPSGNGSRTITPTPTGSPTTISPSTLHYLSSVVSYIEFIGDSLTYGVGSSNADGTITGYNWPGDVMRALGTVDWSGQNRGVSGWSIVEYGAGGTNLTDDLPNWVTANYDATRPFNIAIVMIGTNDLNHVSGATCYSTLVTYCQTVRSHGWKLIILTIPSSTTNTTQRDIYSADIVSGWATFADALADSSGDTHIGVDAAASSSTYFVSGLHMTDAGYATLAPFVLGALERIVKSKIGSAAGLFRVNPLG